ncbi:MAG TPA: ATP-binding protein [Candidatus Acidoferrales bacterium]|nr:ATP-binding protein [Candidatus Acidoferrales bacterium]
MAEGAKIDLREKADRGPERAEQIERAGLELHAQIEERKEAENKLRESEERFRLLVEGVNDYAIFMLDPNGLVASWNQGAARLTGYAAEEIIGDHFAKFYLPEDVRKGLPDRGLRTAEREGRYEAEGWRLRKDGSKFWTNAVINALRDSAGRLYGFVKIARDMTERKRLEQKVRENEQLAAIGGAAAVFAHELGNPLNGISVSLQMLYRQLVAKNDSRDAQSIEVLSSVIKEIRRVGLLLDDFRSLAKPRRLDLEPTNLADLVAELLAVESGHYAERGVTAEQIFAPDLPTVMLDARRVKQALLNLCKNAVEAMPEGGKLTIEARLRDGRIEIDVADTGAGIPEDFPVFEFFQTTKEYGTGLGLAIVRQVVSAHNGGITYRSEPGKGTTFTVWLPLDLKPKP